jgi:putative phosphoesterase
MDARTHPVAATIGLISDTHGVLAPGSVEALHGVTHIIHAGDIGDTAVMRALERLAPLTAVRGNSDRGPWSGHLREEERVELHGLRIGVVHDLATLSPCPENAGLDVIVYGHSHVPEAQRRNGVLYINPGSAGYRRFRLPLSVARLTLGPEGASWGFVNLSP